MHPGFGKRLKKAIKISGLSHTAIASDLDVSPAVITQWTKENTVPSLKHFAPLCKRLKADPNYLIYGGERDDEDKEILEAVYRFRPMVRKALITFLKLI